MMRKGAFAMFDALGTRGIWKRHDADIVVAKFERLEGEYRARLERELGGPNYEGIRTDDNAIHDISVAFLSDTVVVAVIPKEDRLADEPRALAKFMLIVACRFAGIAVRMGAEINPGWSYRGCVSFGDIAIHPRGSFFVGEAVDSAAELFETPDGAFIMLTPTAAALFDDGFPGLVGGIPPLTGHRVPLKDGRHLETLVVSPFDVDTSPEEAKHITEAILGTFSTPGLDVAIKRQNTERWLHAHLEEHSRAFEAQQELVERLLHQGNAE
jgi:hypothetical protein